jgi:hypothetical protein
MIKGRSRNTRHQPHEKRHAMRMWAGRLTGLPAFIIGNSLSVLMYDLSSIDDYFSIGINRAFRGNSKGAFPIDPTILIWQDKSFWQTEGPVVKRSKCIRCCPTNADPERICYNFDIAAAVGFSFDKSSPHLLAGRGSTGPLAVELAVALGCRPIIILGMDCLVTPARTDYFGHNEFWTPLTVTNCNRGLDFIQQKCPVPVLNCGLSDRWPKVTLGQALDLVDKERKLAFGRESYVKRLLDGG